MKIQKRLEAETGGSFDDEGTLHTEFPQNGGGVFIGEQSFWTGDRVFLIFPRRLKSGKWAWFRYVTRWSNDFGPGKYYEDL